MTLSRIGRLAAFVIIASAGMMVTAPNTAHANPTQACIPSKGYCPATDEWCCYFNDDGSPISCGCTL